ncbi:MAG: hypothetical protein JO144_01345, partial [Actinobacteria bacterium]|nr:hypothetical protein [Actinomycetota bacterium]
MTHAAAQAADPAGGAAPQNGHGPQPGTDAAGTPPAIAVSEVGPAAQRIIANIEKAIAGK